MEHKAGKKSNQIEHWDERWCKSIMLHLKPSSLAYCYIEKYPPRGVIGDARLTIDDQSRTASGWLCWRKRWHGLKELFYLITPVSARMFADWLARSGRRYQNMGAEKLRWLKRRSVTEGAGSSPASAAKHQRMRHY